VSADYVVLAIYAPIAISVIVAMLVIGTRQDEEDASPATAEGNVRSRNTPLLGSIVFPASDQPNALRGDLAVHRPTE
jgi:hypothetical protein